MKLLPKWVRSLSRWSRRARVVLPALACVLIVACRDDAMAPVPSMPPGPDPNRSVAVSFCAAQLPVWVAFQEGGGAWTRAVPEVSGNTTTFRHEFSSDRGAIATVTPVIDGIFNVISVLYGAPDELAAVSNTSRAECAGAGTKTLHGTVTGLDERQLAFMRLAPSGAAVTTLGDDFTLEEVTAGPQDLVAAREERIVLPVANPRLIVRRNIDLPDGATIAPLDFNSAEAFEATTANVTITNAARTVISQNALYTSNGQFTLPFISDLTSATTGTRPYQAIPESRLARGEVQLLRVSALGDENQNRTVDTYFRAPIDRTVQFGAPLIAPTITSIAQSGAPLPRLRAHFVSQPEYDKVTAIVYQQGSSPNFLSMSMTPRYASIAGYDIDVPDLVSIPGYDPSWGLRAGETIFWQAFRVGGTLPYGFNAVPFDGAVRIVSQRADTITVR